MSERFKNAGVFAQVGMALGGVVGVFVLALVLALAIGLGFGETSGVANVILIIRDLFIILLAVQGMLIGVALIILILQIAALVNLVQNEIKPITKNLQETADTVKGTSAFITENLVTPIIESHAMVSGIATFMREAANIRKAMQEAEEAEEADPPTTDA